MSQSILLRLPFFLCLWAMSTLGTFAAVEEQPAALVQKRLAIIIGNSNYQSPRLEKLANATNDAARLSDSLKRLNFEVLTGSDLTTRNFEDLLLKADREAVAAGAVLIFYAGHGVQLQGENFLLPVDTPDPDSLEKLTAGAVRLNDVIARYARRDRQTFIFLDACRNNPVGNAGGNGLAQVEVGENTFVAFATQPGNVTVDGSGDNSPFTTALLKNVEIPGLSISDMMIRVRNETESLTVGRQVPWDQSNLREQFYFTEQQVLDPAQLSASLSQILSDPVAKQKLQIELASNDLQTAVLIVGQTLRSVSTAQSPAPAATSPTQVASLETGAALAGARQTVVSGLETLIVGSSPNETDDQKATELARSIQTELRRLGCYRQEIDGDWGKGSQRALGDYYRNTSQASTGTEPSVSLLGDLFLRSGRICKQPVIVKKVKVATMEGTSTAKRNANAGPTRKSAGAKPARAQGKKAISRRPAAPPPDISGGIGIGGVF